MAHTLTMLSRFGVFLFALAIASPSVAQEGEPPAEGQVNPMDLVKWTVGPGTGKLGSIAELTLPEGYKFCGQEDTKMLMEMMGNPVSGQEMGFLAPDSLEWFVVYEWDPSGYVKDDDKDELDADALLENLKQGNEAANTQRRERGWPTLDIVGWETPPAYNPETKNLEWAVRARSPADQQDVVNHNTRVLGRRGVMKVSLVVNPMKLADTLPVYRQVQSGYGFGSGEKYSEWQPGDKVAEYGLVALVAGGAGAVAAKTGILAKLLKGFGKLIVVGIAAIGGLFAKLFGKKNQD